ncbi:MAG: L-lactate permease [Verrucomicrobiota bacterium]
MELGWLAFFAFFPIAFALFRLYATFIPFPHIGPFPIPFGCMVTAVVAVTIWQVSALQVVAGAFQGLFFCAEIIFLLFSAILLVQTLRQSGVFTVFGSEFAVISPDRRIQMILIAWLFGSGVEGLFGFSATGAACALLMVGIGFPPACAVLMAVMGPMTASAFSSLGTPITLGVAGGLQDPMILRQLSEMGWSLDEYLRHTSTLVGILHGIAGTFMPSMMCVLMCRFFGKKQSWKEALDILPFSLLAGIAFTVPFTLTAVYLGPEFPPIFGAIVGLVIVSSAAKLQFFVPREVWDFPTRRAWPKHWFGGKFHPDPIAKIPRWKAWLPFVVLFLLLTLTRWRGSPISEYLRAQSWTWKNVFGSSVTIQSQFLYLPGIYFLLVSAMCFFLYRLPQERISKAFTSWTLPITFMTLQFAPFVMMMAGIYFNTGVNNAHFSSMPDAIASYAAQLPGAERWGAFLSPFLGAAGAFYSSNNIFGNAIFASFQHTFGQHFNNAGSLFLALHIVGASACNIISIHFLSGTCEAVNMPDWSSPTGRKTAAPMLIYLTLVGLIGALLL